MVYEWLCGKLPFRGTMWEIWQQHLYTAPPPLRPICPELPAMLENVVLRALAKKPQDRFVSIQAFARALARASQTAPPVDEDDAQATDRLQPMLRSSPIAQHTALSTQNNQRAQTPTRTQTLAAPESPPALQNQNRIRMLRRLHRAYGDLMSQSLQGAAWLELGLADKPDAVQNVVNLLLHIPNRAEQHLPPGASITETYDEAEHELLILGEPGAGKSTLLLDLAQQLLKRAEQDKIHPLPVILPLSSWAVQRLPLQDWMAEQLAQIYDVPRTLSVQWLQEDGILPLLDGLDEMEETARAACIAAINTYHGDHLAPLVVCSRTTEYEAAASHHRLALQGAVVVQSLTHEHVDAYLVRAGESLRALWSALKQNAALRDLATTPLMLNILILTYQGTSARDLPNRESLLLQQVWDDYVQRMTKRKGSSKHYTAEQTTHWLSSLADLMKQQSQTIFFIEQLQPDWLPSKRVLSAYDWLGVRLPYMLIGALVSLAIIAFFSAISLLTSIIGILLGGFLGIHWSDKRVNRDLVGGQPETTRRVPWIRMLKRFAMGALIGLLVGMTIWLAIPIPKPPVFPQYWWLSFWLSFGFSFGLWNILLPRLVRTAKSPGIGHGLLVGLLLALISGVVFGLIYGLVYGPIVEPAFGSIYERFIILIYVMMFGMIGGLAAGLFLGLFLGLNSGLLGALLMGKGTMVQLVDRLVWSWRSLKKKLFSKQHIRLSITVGLTVGISSMLLSALFLPFFPLAKFNLTNVLSADLINGLLIGFASWMLLGLLQGVSSETIEDRHRVIPNQGIHRSAFNGLVLGLVSAIAVGLIQLLTAWLSSMLTGGSFAPIAGLFTGLFAGLVVCLLNGGLTCLRHYVLRFLLWRTGLVPWRYVQFLDYTAERILLRKVGGGYIFIHRLLLDYFAGLEK
jgi:hypothetical protein